MAGAMGIIDPGYGGLEPTEAEVRAQKRAAERAAADAKMAADKRAHDKAVPSKAARQMTQAVLNDVIEQAVRFRSDPLDSAEVHALVMKVLTKLPADTPSATRTALEERGFAIVTRAFKTEHWGEAREEARGAAYAIAQTLPRTYEVPAEGPTADETAEILKGIPRA
jgi:hypothetical protein